MKILILVPSLLSLVPIVPTMQNPYSGGGGPNASNKKHDMWLDHGPASKLVPDIFYSTNFYAEQAVARLQQRNKSRPFWLHLAYQAVHAPYTSPPKWEVLGENRAFGAQFFVTTGPMQATKYFESV